MSKQFEQFLPFAVATAAGLVAMFADHLFEIEPFSNYVSAGTMALGLIVAGFTATQRNMLLGMGGSRVLRYAARSGYYKDVLSYLARCIYTGLFVTLVSVAGVFIQTGGWTWRVWLALWVGSITLVVGLLILNELLMFRIFKRFMEEQR